MISDDELSGTLSSRELFLKPLKLHLLLATLVRVDVLVTEADGVQGKHGYAAAWKIHSIVSTTLESGLDQLVVYVLGIESDVLEPVIHDLCIECISQSDVWHLVMKLEVIVSKRWEH